MSRAGRLAGTLAVAGLLVLLTVEPTSRAASVAPSLPSFKGLNYGVPLTESAAWVGTSWLQADRWLQVRPAMAADLDFVRRNHLGQVIRLFVAIDQLMDWDPNRGFVGFREGELANLKQALDLFDRSGIRVIAVLFDQEVIGSPGNFRFQALDGRHGTMRAGYLRAAGEFAQWLGVRSTITAIDLFNEAYSSLGTDSNLPRPPAPDPTSPGYPVRVVHDFLRDLYATVKKANPRIPLTVSDATLYWQPQPDLTHYDDILDFYDAHVYDDRPNLRDLRHALDKPYIIGEAGASVVGEHFTDQVIEARAVRSLLEQGRADGALAVLVHSIASQNVFPATRDRLTPTGEVLAQFQGAGAALREPSVWPIAGNERALVPFVTTTGAISPIGGAPWQAIKHLGRETAWESPAQHGWAGGP